MSTRSPVLRRAAAVPVAVLLGSALLAAVLPPSAATPSDPPVPARAETGPTPSAGATQVQAPVPRIDWAGCGAELEEFDCASVEVPTDYDDPTGSTTTLALTRLPARDPERRIGTVFTNPGGPGVSGVDVLQSLGATMFDAEVHDRFDVLGFDPRAVSRSDPATCFDTPAEETAALAALTVPFFPTTAEEDRRYTSEQLRLAGACHQQSGERFAHASTANVARDLDLLRQAVGDEQLTYSGYSYGTMLGATYSMLFPDRVRALSLDGTWRPQDYAGEVGAEDTSVGVRLGQAAGAEKSFTEFLRLCTEAGPEACALARLGDPAVVVPDTLDRLREEPITVPQPEGPPAEITYQAVVTGVFNSLYTPPEFPLLADTLAQIAVAAEDPTAVSSPEAVALEADLAEVGASPRPRRGVDYVSIGKEQAAFCADSGTTGRPLDYPATAREQQERYPTFGASRAWAGFRCEFLRSPDPDAYTGPWEQRVDEPVLVIGTRFDPATPYAATQDFADLYPTSSVLTVEGWGHTVLAGQSTCADSVVADYLVRLQTPADGATCAQDRSPFEPVPTR